MEVEQKEQADLNPCPKKRRCSQKKRMLSAQKIQKS